MSEAGSEHHLILSVQIPATADTVFTVCNTYINNDKNAKKITVSRMGTIQPIIEGAC